MAEIINMPKLGFDMAEGTLVRWVILEGESVSKGAVLAEIETDKATVEVESHNDGIMYKHLVPVGEIVPINSPIAVIAGPDEDVDMKKLLSHTTAEIKAPTEPEIEPEVKSQESTSAESKTEIKTKTGGKLKIEIAGSPLKKNGKVTGMVATVRDITERD